jgi:1-deoxy-D-xylulose-5-phosphate reductoisomerase
MNAANEVAVKRFLQDKIGFLQMSDLIEDVIAKTPFVASPTLDDIIETHNEATKIAEASAENY